MIESGELTEPEAIAKGLISPSKKTGRPIGVKEGRPLGNAVRRKLARAS